jgi:Domain of unknown function (DUF4167)
MRNGQNNKRMRNRNNNNNNNNNNRRGQNPMTRVYESNGPDIKIRGTASHVAEKYVQLARDARSSGDPVAAENYYQHAEHYFRLIAAAQEQFRQNQPQHMQQPRPDNDMSTDESEDDGDGFSPFGQEPGFVPQQQQPQPYMRDNNQRDRDQPPYQRDQQQPREHRGDREHRGEREHREQRPQPQYQPPQPSQPQPPVADSVDRLPSFITGPQPQINGGERSYEGGGGGERYPRRRRRPHGGPRPDNMAGTAPAGSGDDE